MSRQRAVQWLATVLFATALVRTAWVSDDAYITLRSVENFVTGHGLRWNVAERVQVYTHPLWMFLVAGGRALTGEYYVTLLGLSFGLTAAALWVLVRKVAASPAAGALALALCALSMAFVDFSTSGLESPLTHALIAAFAWVWFREEAAEKQLTRLAWIAGFAACNRMDSVLLFGPALLGCTLTIGWKRALPRCLLGFSPFVLWLAFSTFYYGTPFPNTAYAKAFHTGIPAIAMAQQGVHYLLDSLQRDPLTLAVILGAALLSLGSGSAERKRRVLWMAGALLYTGYVVKIGGGFMAGRFLAAPFFMAIVALARWEGWDQRRTLAVATSALAALLSCTLSIPGFLSGPDFSDTRLSPYGIAHERGFYYRGHGLLSPEREKVRPGLVTEMLQAAGRDDTIVGVRQYIGVEGLQAGPQVHVVDSLLCDPLLVRLPVYNRKRWRVGHYARRVPSGYLATLRSGETRIRHSGLARYFDQLRLITRGPLFDRERLFAIVRQLSGKNDALLADYVATDYYQQTRIVASASELPASGTAATPWFKAPAQTIELGGLDLRFDAPVKGKRIFLGSHFGDTLELRFFSGTDEVGTAQAVTSPDFLAEMQEVVVRLPPSTSNGFDRISIRVVDTFDGVAAIGWLRIE